MQRVVIAVKVLPTISIIKKVDKSIPKTVMTFFKGGKWSYIVALAANSIGFVIGTTLTWSSPVIAKLEDDDISQNPLGRKITSDEETWLGSLVSLGSIMSPIIFGPLLQIIGRKKTVVLIGMVPLIGFITVSFAKDIELYYFARVLMGIGSGGMPCIIAVYVVEISENVNRGFLVASTIACVVLGELFSYCLGPYVSVMTFNLILAAVAAVVIPLFWVIGTETPLYLVSKNREKEALKSLGYLRRTSDVHLQKEIDEIKMNLQQSKQAGSISDIFKTKGSIKAFVYSTILITGQQLCGVNVVLYYAQNIFEDAGSTIPSEISSIIIGAVQVLIATICSPFLDRAGRRILLLSNVTLAVLSHLVLGAYFYVQEGGSDVSSVGWIPVIALVAFITAYNFGLASAPWSIVGEILPSNVASIAVNIITIWYSLVGFLLTKYFDSLKEAINMSGSFWLFGGFCLVLDVFSYFFIFETKGKSLLEIQEILNK